MMGLLLVLAQVAPSPPEPGERPNIVSDRLELGFKLCAQHVIQQGILTPDHLEELESLDVQLVDDVADEIKANTGPLFTSDRIFAKIGRDDANVYISTAKNSSACRVITADTQDGLRGRVKFVNDLRRTTSWEYDERRSGTFNGMMKEELLLRNGLMIAIMNGPNHIANEGVGVQSSLTVALLPPKGPN
ncbi:hypothetical protein GRI44_07505 [Altererythrobacter confluentis]|uniref:Uncharacterized protein n=1 Tax=Allopontixanthobacter confluentis TaxID=1849021 RepID=A0A6L7GH25_9SPHN|nr:hypothetical protein [Allopontixanthobacter confluentis]MXP14594.1 hypothetical protein [Allopontixanthobacter confluentis]